MHASTASLAPMLARNPHVHRNLSAARLVETAVNRGEGVLSEQGAISVATGKYTGRSPKDKFVVVEHDSKDSVNWGSVNQPMDPEVFERLYQRVLAYIENKELFVFDGFAGADGEYRLPIRVVNEFAWQNLFARQLFIRPTAAELANHQPGFTLIAMPGFEADPARDGTHSETFIATSFEKRVILIGGTHYAGEIKKSIFSALNYLMPLAGVFPMHCSANVGEGGGVALFFGLSGTGKTTLSADPRRRLIGDDEHGWSDHGVFNFEGGCYAKCIHLSAEKEPQIFNAMRFGAVLENVVIDPASRMPDYDSDALTENTRAAYPVEFIPNALLPGVAAHPQVVVFLTADAFGVMPPIAKLTKDQAMYHFLSGYTSKLAGTERGVVNPEATFSPCFGGPFLTLAPIHYARMLGDRIDRHNVQVYLVNTGWSGGPFGVGDRVPLSLTRTMIEAVLNGSLEHVEFQPDPIFRVLVPTRCPGVPSHLLEPRRTWSDPLAYDEQARHLASLFAKNFAKYQDAAPELMGAGPSVSN